MAVSDQLRKALQTCGETQAAVSRATGISEGILSRFVRGERGLSQATIDTLAAYLRLELKPSDKRRKGS